MSILIAEDQLINVEVLKQNLSQFKLIDNCSFVFNGEDAVNRATQIIEE